MRIAHDRLRRSILKARIAPTYPIFGQLAGPYQRGSVRIAEDCLKRCNLKAQIAPTYRIFGPPIGSYQTSSARIARIPQDPSGSPRIPQDPLRGSSLKARIPPTYRIFARWPTSFFIILKRTTQPKEDLMGESRHSQRGRLIEFYEGRSFLKRCVSATCNGQHRGTRLPRKLFQYLR